jgi:H+/Cl- antiporter ClcA
MSTPPEAPAGPSTPDPGTPDPAPSDPAASDPGPSAPVATDQAPSGPAAPAPAAPPGPLDLLRSRQYLVALVFAAIIGVPIATVAYFFLKWVSQTQTWIYSSLPKDLGFATAPAWWPLPVLVLGGLVVGASIHYLPGTGGHSPANGLQVGGAPTGLQLPGVIIAAFATLASGAVLGPEAPLIAIGGGLAALAVRAVKRDAPDQAVLVIGAAGSFAAVSTLLGSPLAGAFLLMEASGLGGPLMGVLLVPGLLAAGIGYLIFIGLDNLTGFGTFSLAVPKLPAFTSVTGAEFLWAIVIGLLAAAVGTVFKYGARRLKPVIDRRRVPLTPLLGAGVAVAAIIFGQATTHGATEVLFSGQTALGPLLEGAAGWSVGALLLLVVCKGVAYTLSMSGFRGGPTFPAMFIGAAGGIALSHLPGLPMVAGAAMGIGAMTVTILGLPLSSVLLTTLFLASDGITLMPLIIVSVVVAYVASGRLAPRLPAPTD